VLIAGIKDENKIIFRPVAICSDHGD